MNSDKNFNKKVVHDINHLLKLDCRRKIMFMSIKKQILVVSCTNLQYRAFYSRYQQVLVDGSNRRKYRKGGTYKRMGLLYAFWRVQSRLRRQSNIT